jgi:hypothetical protein
MIPEVILNAKYYVDVSLFLNGFGAIGIWNVAHVHSIWNLTGGIYVGYLQNELPELLDNIPLWIKLQMSYQHDGALPHLNMNKKYLNEQFPGRWISHDSTLN